MTTYTGAYTILIDPSAPAPLAIRNFLNELPDALEGFFNDLMRDEIKKTERVSGVGYELFFQALLESRDEMERNRDYFDNISEEELRAVGFTDKSLQMKATMLNRLWAVAYKTKEKGESLLDKFKRWLGGKSKIFASLQEFLRFLSWVLDSLLKNIPGLENMKELVQTAEMLAEMSETRDERLAL